MPTMKLTQGGEMFYQVDDFTDPWIAGTETVVMLHGNAESGEAWRAWIPHFARRYRVVRPDMRGFGRSTPAPEDFPWTIDLLVEDLAALARHLGVDRFHLVAAKIGGTIALKFAADHPDMLTSLTVLGVPPAPKDTLASTVSQWVPLLREQGLEGWARQSMRGRLGSEVPDAMLEYWTALMARTSLSTQLGFMRMVPTLDVTPGLARIACPTLVITTTGSGLGSVEDTRAWSRCIANSELLVIPGDSYHVAASNADQVAPMVEQFIARQGSRRAQA